MASRRRAQLAIGWDWPDPMHRLWWRVVVVPAAAVVTVAFWDGDARWWYEVGKSIGARGSAWARGWSDPGSPWLGTVAGELWRRALTVGEARWWWCLVGEDDCGFGEGRRRSEVSRI
ncbi:hypothetical protein Droror1_Dr00026557 [Drosera rotundifolia]